MRGGVPVVHVAGELDTSSISELAVALTQARMSAASRVVVELSRVTFCSVDGVRALYQADADMRAAGTRMELLDPHSAVRRVLELAGLLQHWDIGPAQNPTEQAIAERAHLAGVLKAAMSATGAIMGTAQHFDAADGALQLVAHSGFDRQFVSFFETVKGEGTSCGAAASDLRPVYVDDVGSSPIYAGSPELDALVEAGVGSCVSLPIATAARRLVGVVSTHRPLPGPWSDGERNLLENVRTYASELVAAA